MDERFEFQAEIWDGVDDLTTYLDADNAHTRKDIEGFSMPGHIYLCHNGGEIGGRGLICKCYKQRFRSVTVRVQANTKMGVLTKYKPRLKKLAASLYAPSATPNAKFPISLQTICEVLFYLLPELREEHPRGVIVVTGSTNAGKSKIARGLIYRYLQEKISGFEINKPLKQRRPHLVTIEDPIEDYFFTEDLDDPSPKKAQEYGLDYTPREIGKDTGGLADAFADALRQTPSVVYVGEVRDKDEWKPLIDFAGTGHLVVTTAHAGSLVEAMDRIMQATDATVPARRGQVADCILAVIHLESVPLGMTMDKSVVLPAIWRRTSSGISTFVADGLASIVPNILSKGKTQEASRRQDASISSIGRLWFAEQCIAVNDQLWGYLLKVKDMDKAQRQKLARAFTEIAERLSKDQNDLFELCSADLEILHKLWAYCKKLLNQRDGGAGRPDGFPKYLSKELSKKVCEELKDLLDNKDEFDLQPEEIPIKREALALLANVLSDIQEPASELRKAWSLILRSALGQVTPKRQQNMDAQHIEKRIRREWLSACQTVIIEQFAFTLVDDLNRQLTKQFFSLNMANEDKIRRLYVLLEKACGNLRQNSQMDSDKLREKAINLDLRGI